MSIPCCLFNYTEFSIFKSHLKDKHFKDDGSLLNNKKKYKCQILKNNMVCNREYSSGKTLFEHYRNDHRDLVHYNPETKAYKIVRNNPFVVPVATNHLENVSFFSI